MIEKIGRRTKTRTLDPLINKLLAAEPVDLLLVLAADVSRSVDQQKFQLQREGYAAAITDPRVLNPIRPGLTGRIASASSNGRASDRRTLSSIGC